MYSKPFITKIFHKYPSKPGTVTYVVSPTTWIEKAKSSEAPGPLQLHCKFKTSLPKTWWPQSKPPSENMKPDTKTNSNST